MNQRQCCFLIFIALLTSSSTSHAEPSNTPLQSLLRGEKLFQEGCYPEAIAHYREAISGLSDDQDIVKLIPKKLSHALFFNENYAELIELLDHPLDSSEYFLKALAYRKLDSEQEAVDNLQTALNLATSQQEAVEIKLQLADALSNLKQKNQAVVYWSEITEENQFPAQQLQASLQLARYHLQTGNLAEAEIILNQAVALQDQDNPNDDLAYWQGKLAFLKGDYAHAVESYAKILHNPHPDEEAHAYLLWAESTQDLALKHQLYEKAENLFLLIAESAQNEGAWLQLGKCYVTKGKELKDIEAYKKAESVLSQSSNFQSEDVRSEALLLLAESCQTLSRKEEIYTKLIEETPVSSFWNRLGIHFHALQQFEEGVKLSEERKITEADLAYEKALNLWSQLSQQDLNSIHSIDAVTARAYIYLQRQSHENLKQANEMLKAKLQVAEADQNELNYLYGLSCYFLSTSDPAYTEIARNSWKNIISGPQENKWTPQAYYALGQLEWHYQDFGQSEEHFAAVGKKFPHSPLAPEALFFASRAAEKQQKNREIVAVYRRLVFEKYPDSPFASEAYLSLYPNIDYLHLSQIALKHLQAMPQKFPDSLWTINAYFLLGLDNKKERRSPEGKLLHKERFHSAIESFQNAEALFFNLQKNNRIPSHQLSYFTILRVRATLERALVNIAIADQSTSSKRRIYLEYAAEVFEQLIQEIENDRQLLTSLQQEPYPSLLEESQFGLAQTYARLNDSTRANQVLDDMLVRYHAENITRGYLLSRVWYEKGQFASQQENYQQALDYYLLAEEAAKGKLLSSDQQIDLWIQQSYALRHLNRLDQAMLILSKAINEDVVSALRLKAMYLRAEIYLEENRPELALRQLEALAKKGGDWGQKAQDKLLQIKV